MKITKLDHAALVIEAHSETLLVDPGAFTPEFVIPDTTAGVVLTHEHADHWTPEHLTRIRRAAPHAPIYAPEGVAHTAKEFDISVVSAGDARTAGRFQLRFFGGVHELIHASIPLVDNVGVLVNNALYYGGDSYSVPEDVNVEVLAAPLGAPWLRISDAMDYVTAVGARRVFATHDKTLSQIGASLHRDRLAWAASEGGGEFVDLHVGETLHVTD